MTPARALTLRAEGVMLRVRLAYARRRTRRLVAKNGPALVAGISALLRGALAQQRYDDALATGDPERIAEAAQHLMDGREAA